MSAAALRALHRPRRPVVLPNAWDAASARLVVDAGFPVVATSSGAVAQSLGHADHEGAPAEQMLAAAARIVEAVDVPVTVDVEAGYGLAPDQLATDLLKIGAVGCNIEDTDHATGTLRDAGAHARWLAALHEAAGDGLVINARVDCFLDAEHPATVLPSAVDRAKRYLHAGADCVYPILLRSPELIERFVQAVQPAAVNVINLPDGPSVGSLAELGVARISLGTGLFRQQQDWLRARLAEIAAAS